MEYVASRGAKKLLIVSNTKLSAARFREVPIDLMEYDRVNIQLELML